MAPCELVIPTLFGLEGVCAQELKRLDAPNIRAENGRVLCDYTPEMLIRANLCLRTGERVLLRLGSFPAPDFDALYDGANALPWEEFIPRDAAFPIRCRTIDSKLSSQQRCVAVTKAALAARLGKAYGLGRLPETGPEYQVRLFILKDVAELYLDTTGPSLHKRGYRALSVTAPLRETLAAGMVLLSRYRGRDPFRDPFCGSGTIAIEAALIARNRAPGLDRSFDAQKWKWLDSRFWLDAASEAMDGEFDGSYDIWGGDIDPRAVRIARENAVKAGVDDVVRFDTADAAALRCAGEYGQLVTNPPYGERLLEQQEAEALYRMFGTVYRSVPPRWRVLVLTSHPDFEKFFGRKADKKRKLYNGMIKCDLYQFSRAASGCK